MMVGSLFAGIGGFDLAAENVGMEIAWQSENDVEASAVLAHHWPEVTNYGDIHDIHVAGVSGKRHDLAGEGSQLDRRSTRSGANANGEPNARSLRDEGVTDDRTPSAVDVLCGGFPCQDYSVAGRREGLVGDRGALWWQFHRLIGELRPTWVVAENVPGLLSSRDGQDFETIIRSLTELGYGVVWTVLDAQYFGVAQRRRRVFIVGHSGGEPRPEILALSEGLYGHTPPSRKTGTVPAALTASGLGGGGPDDNLAQAGHLIGFNWQSGQGQLSARASHIDALHAGQVPAVAFAQNQRDEVRDLGDKAGALAAEPGTKQQTYVIQDGREIAKNQNGLGISETDTAYTLDQTGAQSIAQKATVRRLTPLECERLQGFPDNWTNTPGNSDTQRYRQLGNAVAVPVAQWVFNQIVEAA